MTKTVLETALEAEMTEHLGYDRHDPVGRDSANSRNGTRTKTVLTEIGPVEIEVPRDRDASWIEPKSRTAWRPRAFPAPRRPSAHIPTQEASMTLGVVAVRHHRRRVVTTPEETSSAVLTHVALAITRYVRQLRKDGLPVPSMLDELATFMTLYVRTRQAATGVDGGSGTLQDVPVRRLLITKAEAAEQLGISVRTVERLIAAGRLPLVHVEGAARLRLADLEAYVDALVPQDIERSERENEV